MFGGEDLHVALGGFSLIPTACALLSDHDTHGPEAEGEESNHVAHDQERDPELRSVEPGALTLRPYPAP